MSGGTYPEVGESCQQTWINDVLLRSGHAVTVSFLEVASTSHPRKIIEELFRDDPLAKQSDLKSSSDVFAELRAAPKLSDKFSFRLVSSSGRNFRGETAANEHGFGFMVLWNSYRPDIAKFSLLTSSLNGLEARIPMNNHSDKTLQYV